MKYDVLFISNYSNNLNSTLSKIGNHIPENINYLILTYKRTNIKNSISYEDFLLNERGFIDSYEVSQLNLDYKNVNFYLSAVSDRFLTDYYGSSGILGNKKILKNDLEFFIKSWVLFIDRYVKDSNIVFSGYADNMISHLAYTVSEYRRRRCISFNTIQVVNSGLIYLVEGIYMKPCLELVNNTPKKNIRELEEYIGNFSTKKALSQFYSHKEMNAERPLFGFISPSLIKLEFWMYMLFGYTKSDKRVKYFLEMDRVSFFYKTLSYIKKIKNIITSKTINFDTLESVENCEKLIYFPLQVQPEASTAATSPLFMNLISTVELLSKSLPIGYTLVVKEHPVVNGIRGRLTYKNIKSLNNVLLVDKKVSGKKIIEASEMVIGFGGTTLIEAVSMGVKILIFEDSFYSDGVLIRKIKDMKSIKNEILDFLETKISSYEKDIEFCTMLNYFNQRGFKLNSRFEENIAKNLLKLL